jgi:hypothetical protein
MIDHGNDSYKPIFQGPERIFPKFDDCEELWDLEAQKTPVLVQIDDPGFR